MTAKQRVLTKKRERFVAYDGRVTTFTKDGKRTTRIAARRIKEKK